MNKADYEMVALVLRQAQDDFRKNNQRGHCHTAKMIAQRMARQLKLSDPDFSSAKFLEACDA